jgi:hypothetical protein
MICADPVAVGVDSVWIYLHQEGEKKDHISVTGQDGVFAELKSRYYAYSTIKTPDKGEVGGSSPPRPTKYSSFEVRGLSRGQFGAAPSRVGS